MALLPFCIFAFLPLSAQEVTVTVTPVQQVLPPQAMLYMNDPGKYFTITLINNTSMQQQVYLGIDIEQVMPASGLNLSTPPRRQPQTPITLSAGQVRQLTMVEMKNMFNHVPKNEVRATPGLINDYENGAFGLLPEGQYRGQIIAYKWDLTATRPVALSSSSGGRCFFTICYKAQAPEFLTPMMSNGGGFIDLSVAKLDKMNPQFTWKAPVVTCNPQAAQFTYEFRIVELLPGQQPDVAMRGNASVFIARDLTVPMVTIPITYVNKLDPKKTYVAQVKAKQSGVGAKMLNYVMIENEGKSPFRMFRIGDDEKEDDQKEEKTEEEETFTNPDAIRDYDEEGNSDGASSVGTKKKGDGREVDSTYVFSLPEIKYPTWDEGMTRKVYLGSGIDISWNKIYKTAGTGQRADTLDIKYDVELYRTSYDTDYEEVFKTKPILKKNVAGDKLSLEWEDDLEKLELVHNDYIVMRINPIVKGEKSIRFEKGTSNVLGFAMSEHTTKSYFQCTSTVEITNHTPTKRSVSDLKGKVVSIGEYNLTIDKIEKVKGQDSYKGFGHVEWNPMGLKVMVAVKFDTLYINTDDQVYAGRVKSFTEEAKKKESDIEVVDKLFSDAGIDEFFGDNSIPYASQIQSKVTGEAYNVAKKTKLSKYYAWVKKGQSVWDQFMKGEISDLHTPVAIPKKYNMSPCDIQIVSMIFGPDYATMNIIGEFVLPDTKYTDDNILILGAPRICISPKTLLPESGTIALLGDFTVVDPKTSYKCTFKCPTNALTPEDGTYISWHDNKFEQLGIDVSMTIPGTMKEVNGQATNENASLRLTARIDSWETLIARATMQPFQVSGAPGYTFTAREVIVDLSRDQNFQTMTLPKAYDRTKMELQQDVQWQGLYIKEVSVELPKSFEFGTNSDKRLKVSLENMYFDKSGATFSATVNNILEAKTGKVGGWSFSMDKIFLNVMQDDFRDCGFSGTFSVPLLRDAEDKAAKIGYDCRILKIKEGVGAGENAYIFKTQQVGDVSLDCFLAQTTFDKKQTYFLVEAAPDGSGTLKTNVELVMGGTMSIKGMTRINKELKKADLPLDLSFEGIHFCGMRIANCKNDWVSRFETEMQKTAKTAKLEGKEIYAGKEFEIVKNKLYFTTGRFSFSSQEKWLGPFNFSLDKYDFSYSKENNDYLLKFSIGGSVKLVDNLELGGSVGLGIVAKVSNLSLDNLSDISLKYKTTEFQDLHIDCSVAGCTLKGDLEIVNNDADKEGFSGKLKFALPGDLLVNIDAEGGFFRNKKDKFNYGWFHGKLSPTMGFSMVKSGELGFYYNCARNKDGQPVPKKNSIGFTGSLSIAALDPSMFSCDANVTCVFDVKESKLSSLILTGTMKGGGGAFSGGCNIVYQHDDMDRYLTVDVTIDGTQKVDKKVGGFVESLSSDMEKLKAQLNEAYEPLKQIIPEGGLQGQLSSGEKGSKPSNPKGDYNGEDDSGLEFEKGWVVNLGLKITFKKDGKKCNPVKWYFCVGNPDNRCRYTFLKFNAGIASCDIGANGYLCFGNQLYDNGKLPDIPEKIRTFLNGKGASNGAGSIEGATLSTVERIRQNQLKAFESQFASNGGGVMLGAQVYGYFNVDLGILQFDAGITAGLDISLVKLSSDTYCVNLTDKNGKAIQPGWNGWYLKGQLYAYIYAKLGVYIDIGFWSGHWDLLDAGVGGVFNYQGPNPSYLSGEARVKVSLMNGWIDIDRKYEFDVGQSCYLFAGNALDEFKLFGDLDIAKDNYEHGWAYENRINPKLISKPILKTEAPLEEPFRVVDPTHMNILESKYPNIDKTALEAEASATFVFRSNIGSTVTLYEYPDSTAAWANAKKNGTHLLLKNRPTKRTFNIKNMRYDNVLDIMQLTPDRFYMMEVTGYAKEILYGQEEDPRKWNPQKKQYESVPWSKTKRYYFRTAPTTTIPDEPDLQDYVAIAFPSYNNQLRGENWLKVHASDVSRPTISLNANLQGKSFTKGRLIWRLKDFYGGKVLSESENKWITSNNTCIMTPKNDLTGYTNGKNYSITLNYEQQVYDEEKGKMVTASELLALYYVIPQNTEWKTVVYGYEKPFVGVRPDVVTLATNAPTFYDCNFQKTSSTVTLGGKTKQGYFYDPYTYMSYLSNWAFVGGWQFSGDRIDADILSCQSLIYTDKGGVYEGSLSKQQASTNVRDGATRMRELNIYDGAQWRKYTDYPLPVMTKTEYNYALPGLPRAVEFVPAQNGSKRNLTMVSNYLKDWLAPWQVAVKLNDVIQSNLKKMDEIDESYISKGWTKHLNAIESWYAQRHGGYATANYRCVTAQIPYYQFPIVYGSCLTNSGVQKKLTMWGTIKGLEAATRQYATARGHESVAEYVFGGLYGKDKRSSKTNYVTGTEAKALNTMSFSYDSNWLKNYMPWASFSIYRCNAYDIKNGCYTVITEVYGSDEASKLKSIESFRIDEPLYKIEYQF
jgi:hypothetical protein